MPNKDKWEIKPSEIFNIIVIFIAATVLVIIANDSSTTSENIYPSTDELIAEYIEEKIAKQSASLFNYGEIVRMGMIDDTLPLPSEYFIFTYQMSQLKQSTSKIDGRLDTLEQVILNNPSKALEIPMIKKDLNNLESRLADQLVALRRDIDRNYEQINGNSERINGFTITIFGGFFLVAISPFITRMIKNWFIT